MKTMISEQEKRLDQIFFAAYSDKVSFNEFLLANHNYLMDIYLKGGEEIRLPAFKKLEIPEYSSPLLNA